MRRTLHVMALVIIAGLLAGCASRINKNMEAWRGRHVSELVASWGAPQRVFSDGYGGQVLVYATRRSYTAPSQSRTTMSGQAHTHNDITFGTASATTTYTPGASYGYEAQRVFMVDTDGTIYGWQWKGL